MDALVMNWRSALMAMVVSVILICAVILLFRRAERASSNFLALALLFAAFSMGPQIIGFAGAYAIWPWLTFFPLFYADLWIGPLLYLHADRLMRGGRFGWKTYLLVPGAVQTLYYLGAFILPGLFDHEAKWAFNNTVHEPFIVPVESLLGIALLVWALIAIWRMRKAYLDYLNQTQSTLRDYDPIWLRNLILALAVALILFAVLEVGTFIGGQNYDAAFPVQLLIMIVISWLGLDATWRLTSTFPKMTVRPSERTVSNNEPGLASRIDQTVKSEKWYLESRLSIRDIATRLGTNESYISRAVNGELGQSFNQYINALRIDHAKALLGQSGSQILSIALDSGFNSKATFNRVFRDMTGQTPSQFRKSQKP